MSPKYLHVRFVNLNQLPERGLKVIGHQFISVEHCLQCSSANTLEHCIRIFSRGIQTTDSSCFVSMFNRTLYHLQCIYKFVFVHNYLGSQNGRDI